MLRLSHDVTVVVYCSSRTLSSGQNSENWRIKSAGYKAEKLKLVHMNDGKAKDDLER